MTGFRRIAGIILAAGQSRRMGRTKQLLPFQDTTLLGKVLETARRSRLHERILVLGHDADRIIRETDCSDVRVIVNPGYEKGQAGSLIRGLSAVSPECDGAIFLLADQPLITPAIINRLAAAFETTDATLVVPFCRGRRGNPVIAAARLFPELCRLTRDTGARALFDRYADQILPVSLDDEAVLEDVDTPADYDRIQTRFPFHGPNQ